MAGALDDLNWLMSNRDTEALQSLVRRFDRPEVVEVGSWLGHSALAMVAAGAARVHCVDTWAGTDDPNDATYPVRHGEPHRTIFSAFLSNVGSALARTIFAWPAESSFMAGHWKIPVDLVFLDADHRYEAIRDDIALWTPHVRPGGILCGHDYSEGYPGVRRAVEESGPFEVLGSYVWWRQL